MFEEVGGESGDFGEVDAPVRRFEAKVDRFGGHMTAIRRHRPDLQRFQPHPEFKQCYVDNFVPEQRGNSKWWDITVNYTSAIEQEEDPLAQAADISWETTEITRVVTMDRKGRPIVNTAGSLLVDLQEEMGILVCRIEKNVAAVPRWFADYANAVCSDSPRIDGFVFPQRTGLLKRWRLGKWETQKDIRFRRLEMEILYNKDTWDRKVLNRGLLELTVQKVLDPKTFKIREAKGLSPMLNDKDETITEPQFLDRFGRRPRVYPFTASDSGKTITNGEDDGPVKAQLDPEDILVLTFETKNQLPFSGVLPFK